jgi:serine/threonine protein kinase
VHKQIGAGAQAKVYKIQKKNHHAAAIERRASPQVAEKANSESGGGDNTEKIYAIKVIVRDKLDQRDIAEKLQLVNEIHIQRALRYCGNTIKLLKIYESDRYLNLLLEY